VGERDTTWEVVDISKWLIGSTAKLLPKEEEK